MQTFVVECYWPGMTEDAARDILRRIARVATGSSPAEAVQPLGCVLVPSDGMGLYFLAAQNEAVVRRVGAHAEVPFDRIVESLNIELGRPPALPSREQ